MKAIRAIKNSRGSAVIEAVVGFTAFLFTVFTIMNVVNYCRVQMLVSNALDTAAKELTQYSYFYKMSGLNKINKELSEANQVSAGELNGVIGTVSDLYNSVSKTVDDGGKLLSDADKELQDQKFGEFKDTVVDGLKTVKDNANNVKSSMEGVQGAFNEVADDPIYYLKCIALVAGSNALEGAKSHFIAAPLAKSLFIKHFGENADEADKELRKLGVVNGLDGMNFDYSTIFSSVDEGESEDIHFVVCYRVKLTTFFKGLDLSATFCKESRARAWLAGDNVDFGGSAKAEDLEEEDESNTDPNAEGSEEDQENEEAVNTEGSYWHLEGRSQYGNSNRDHAFYEYFKKSNGNMEQYLDGFINGIKGTTVYSYNDYTDASGLKEWLSQTNSSTIKQIQTLEEKGKENIESGDVMPDGKPIYGLEEAKVYHMVVYVPENIDESKPGETQKMEQALRESEAQYKAAGYTFTYEIVKAGGNYDYSNG